MKPTKPELTIVSIILLWLFTLAGAGLFISFCSGCASIAGQGSPPAVVMIDGEGKLYLVQCYNQDCSLYCINRTDGTLDCGGYNDPKDLP